VSDKSKTVKFEVVDSFGKPFKADKLKATLVDLSDNKATVKDISSQAKLDNSFITWSIPSDQTIGRYQPLFQLNGYTLNGAAVTVTDLVKFSSLQYAVL
jgi:response regulator of citrate/malate metabolism